MGVRTWLGSWPVLRQVTGDDRLGRGSAVRSAATAKLQPRTSTADRVVPSVCPYCAVGCGQRIFVKDEKVVAIEGDSLTDMTDTYFRTSEQLATHVHLACALTPPNL